jgi:hypothetical protein
MEEASTDTLSSAGDSGDGWFFRDSAKIDGACDGSIASAVDRGM